LKLAGATLFPVRLTLNKSLDGLPQDQLVSAICS
jgi:hypothetical protein